MSIPILTIDVAHPPRHPAAVEENLLDAFSRVRNAPSVRVLKVIHGYGSTGRGGSTREVVRNWIFSNRGKFKAVVNGEEYGLFSAVVQDMRKEIGAYADPDLDSGNAGITVVWVK